MCSQEVRERECARIGGSTPLISGVSQISGHSHERKRVVGLGRLSHVNGFIDRRMVVVIHRRAHTVDLEASRAFENLGKQ